MGKMTTEAGPTTYPFLSGDSEAAELIRKFDWDRSSLGPIDQWPVSLRTTVGLLLHSAFPMLLFWGDDLITFYNDAFRPSLGADGKHPSIGKKGSEMWADIWDVIHPLMQRVMETGKAVWFEDELVPFHRNGKMEQIYWTFSYSPAYNDSGKIAGVFVTCYETTDKVLGLKKMEESRDELETIIEAAELGTWEYDPATGVFEVNERLKSWGGLQPEERLTLEDAMTFVHPQDRDRVAAAIGRALDPQLRLPYDAEYTMINGPEDRTREVRSMGRAYFDAEGRVLRFKGTLQDITELKMAAKNEIRARRIVEENDRILRNAIRNAPIAICLLRGPEYVVEIASDRMFELWGKPVEAMMHKPMFDGIPEVRDQGYEAIMEHVYTKGQPYSGHNWPVKLNRFGNMQDEFVDFLFEPQFNENGKVSGMLAVALLVTEQVKARRLIEETVALRTAELATANERLLRSNEELKQFAYVTSHDLQEPIRKAAIFTTQLEEVLVDPSPVVKTLIDKIFKSHRRILSLIRDILNYSELGARAVTFEPVDLQVVVEQVRTDFEMLIAQNQAVIKTPVPLPVIDAIPSQLFQLFSNLVSNALKFAKTDVSPVIEIDSRIEGDQVFIDVADNGIGFDEQHADLIFAIFQRLHRQADYSGNGIGLALTRKIVANHHGKIWVNSKAGEGTTFHIQLPLRQDIDA